MDIIWSFFDVNNTLFTLLGYQISYLEFFGTLFNLACVILVARRSIWNWPVGLVGVLLFGALFYQVNLYADFFEQIYYFLTGIAGWYLWSKRSAKDSTDDKARIERNSLRVNIAWLSGIAVLSIISTWALTHIHEWLPGAFPEPASLPALDATTTIMSFAAQFLMMKRRIESWYLWIAVDIVGIWLYWYKDVPFVALLYLLFLINALYGLRVWAKSRLTTGEQHEDKTL